MKIGYLDWAATTPLNDYVLKEMIDVYHRFPGNPSSIHKDGKNAKLFLESDRKKCADLLETDSRRIYFTSGGTESNSIVMNSLLLRRTRGNVIISGIEHPSLFEYVKLIKSTGYTVTIVNPDKNGVISPPYLSAKLQPDTVMVIVMMVNNETGIVQPVKEIVQAVRIFERKIRRPVHVHTDAVQALGKIIFSLEDIDVDSASFSAHKIEGPRGTGLLYAKKPFPVLSAGGGQESGMRPGTENIPGIHGLTTALELYYSNIQDRIEHAKNIKTILLNEYKKIPEINVLTTGFIQSPFIINASIKYFPGEVFTRMMSDRGFAISSGSACSSRNKVKKTRVLTAMGLKKEEAFNSYRVSTGFSTTEATIHLFCSAIRDELYKVRRR